MEEQAKKTETYVVSYIFAGHIGNTGSWRQFFGMGVIDIPGDDAQGRHVAMRIKDAVVQLTGTDGVVIVNFWPVKEAS